MSPIRGLSIGLCGTSPIAVFLVAMIDGDCKGSLLKKKKRELTKEEEAAEALSEEIRRMDAAAGTIQPEPDVNYEKRT